MGEQGMGTRFTSQTTFRRRRFFRGALGVSLAAASGAVAFGVVGCGNDDGKRGAETVPGTAASQSPAKRGGVLKEHQYADSANLDLRGAGPGDLGGYSMPTIFNSLLQNDPDPRVDTPTLQPDLATSWEFADPTTLVFHLRQGVTFHDGQAFTSEDVKTSLQWMKSPPQGKISTFREAFAALDVVDTPDPNTVRLKLARPNPSLLARLGNEQFVIPSAKDTIQKGGIEVPPNGTGPFKFKSYERGVSLEVERNPNYHVSGRPYLDGATYFIIPSQDAAKASFISGQLHVYFSIARPPEDQDDIRSTLRDKAEYLTKIGAGRRVMWTNARKAPFNDLRVRQAIYMAFDRKEVEALASSNKAIPGGYMAPGGAWAIPTDELSKVPGYGAAQISEAKRLLAAAGVPDGVEVTLTTGTIYQPLAELQQSQLAKIGIKLKLNLVEVAQVGPLLREGTFDLGYTSAGSVFEDDPDTVFGLLSLEKSVLNYSGVHDPKVQNLFDQQTVELDADARKRLVQELERLCLGLYQSPAYNFIASSLAHHKYVREFCFRREARNDRLENVWLDT
jgi:peptide/nickel transport system substrate-binding protein